MCDQLAEGRIILFYFIIHHEKHARVHDDVNHKRRRFERVHNAEVRDHLCRFPPTTVGLAH